MATYKILFLHPDLGIGGAERAMIDAALALKSSGHTVQFLTAHHDPDHCFEETRDGRLDVSVAGDWLPCSLMGRCRAVCAWMRMFVAAMWVICWPRYRQSDLVIVDQVSLPVPILRLFGHKVLFYCHFPDLLLTERKTKMKRLYRVFLDWFEEWSTGWAHRIVVNSKFTADVFSRTFRSLRSVEPCVLYPIPNLAELDAAISETVPEDVVPSSCQLLFLSINRYERKKNIGLAIQALKVLLDSAPEEKASIHLVIAGGYDTRVTENLEHYAELVKLADELQVSDHVSFVRSCSAGMKASLLRRATALVYTPSGEHFGIVPVEAMYLGCPVVAVRSGGPMETVMDHVTGFLCEPTPTEFAAAMLKFVNQTQLSRNMGAEGRNRVITRFSFNAFKAELGDIVRDILTPE